MKKKPSRAGPRHAAPDRAFHWAMAIIVFVLGGSAFLPIVGLKFDWVPWHWISGILLVLAILFHLHRVFAVHGLAGMSPGGDDVKELIRLAAGRPLDGLAPAKYDALQKGMHHAVALIVLVLTLTGLVMLAKIDTPFWNRDPSILSDAAWGVIYVAHGFASMALLFLVIVHVYFGLIPEHKGYLAAMLKGRGPMMARNGDQS